MTLAQQNKLRQPQIQHNVGPNITKVRNQHKGFLRGKQPSDENAYKRVNVTDDDELIAISRPAVTRKSLGHVAPKNTQFTHPN